MIRYYEFKYLCSVNWAKQFGTKFQKGVCVVIGEKEDELIFGEIINVFIANDKILLQISILNTLEFSDHLHSFVVTKSTEPELFIWSSDLCSHLVYGLYSEPLVRTDFSLTVFWYVVMKYKVIPTS